MDTIRVIEAYRCNPDFQNLLAWGAGRRRNAWVTSLDVFERELGISRARAVKLAKFLQGLGCAQYVKGQRSKKSRVIRFNGLWAVLGLVTSPVAA
jgi:hypothetical protein